MKTFIAAATLLLLTHPVLAEDNIELARRSIEQQINDAKLCHEWAELMPPKPGEETYLWPRIRQCLSWLGYPTIEDKQ